jgi:hypothetical protein
MEYRERKKLIDWPRKGLLELLLTKRMTLLCCGRRSHQESFETGAPEQVEDQQRLLPVQDSNE